MSERPIFRRWPLFAAAAIVAAATVVALVLALRCGPAGPDKPAPVDAGPAGQSADVRTTDTARDVHSAPPDVGVERRRRHGTRIISSRELRAVQRRYRGLVKLCYDRATRRGSGLVPSKARVTVQLADRGRVRSVKVDAGGALGTCMRRMVRGWRFSRSLKAQKVRFSFVFAR